MAACALSWKVITIRNATNVSSTSATLIMPNPREHRPTSCAYAHRYLYAPPGLGVAVATERATARPAEIGWHTSGQSVGSPGRQRSARRTRSRLCPRNRPAATAREEDYLVSLAFLGFFFSLAGRSLLAMMRLLSPSRAGAPADPLHREPGALRIIPGTAPRRPPRDEEDACNVRRG